MPPPAATSAEPVSTRARVASVGSELRARLEEVVLAVVGPMPRPVDLISATGMDKSLAGRLLKTVRSTDPLVAIHACPSPQGLRLFLDAAERGGAGAEVIGRGREAVSAFEGLIRDFTGGRSALDAAVVGWLPDARAREQRAARQSIHKSMSTVLGYLADIHVGTQIITPCNDPDTWDNTVLFGRVGLRRLRHGTPLAILGTRRYPTDAMGRELPGVENIHGEVSPPTPAGYLVEPFCSAPLPRLELRETADQTMLALMEDSPDVNVPVTIFSALVLRQSWLRYRSEHRQAEWNTQIPRIPCRLMLNDFVLHRDVEVSGEPYTTVRLLGLGGAAPKPGPSGAEIDHIDMPAETSWHSFAEGSVGNGSVPRYPELLSHILEARGFDPVEFRVYRRRTEYPLPFVAVATWWDLPERPA